MKCKSKQIRTYWLHPRRRVVDHRTHVEVQDVGAILDGELDALIEAALLNVPARPLPPHLLGA